MPIIQVLLVLAVIGFVLWLVTTYIPMAPPIKTVGSGLLWDCRRFETSGSR